MIVGVLGFAACLASAVDLPRLYSQFGASPQPPILSVAEVAPGLRGVRAEDDVKPGGLLLRLPSDGCLLVRRGPEDDVQLSKMLLDAIADPEGYGPAWAEYTAALPRATGAAMLWQPDEIAELQLPHACARAEALSERIKETGARTYTSAGDAGDWAWAMSIVYSRSLILEAPGEIKQ